MLSPRREVVAIVAVGEATMLYDYLHVEMFKVEGGREG